MSALYFLTICAEITIEILWHFQKSYVPLYQERNGKEVQWMAGSGSALGTTGGTMER